MQKQKLISQIQDFITTYTKKNTKTMVSSNTIYNYFCFLYQKNNKELTINAFIPYFCKIYTTIENKQLKKKIFKVKQKTIRCLDEIELVPCTLFDSTINFEKNMSDMSTSRSTLSSTLEAENITELEINGQTSIQSTKKSGSTPVSTSKVESYVDPIVAPDFSFLNEWLENYCNYSQNNNSDTPIHVLIGHYSKLYLNNIIVDKKYNRTFVTKLQHYGNIVWPGSNLKKEDKARKQNTAYIKGLSLKTSE